MDATGKLERLGSGTPDNRAALMQSMPVIQPDLPLSSASSCSDVALAASKKEKKKRAKQRARSPAASEASLLGHVQPSKEQQALGASSSGMGRPTMSSSTTSSILGASLGGPPAIASPQPTSHGADRQKEMMRARRRGQTMILPGSARLLTNNNVNTIDGINLPGFLQDRPLDHQPLLRMPSLSSLANNRTHLVLSPTPRSNQPLQNASMLLTTTAPSSVMQQLALSPPVGQAVGLSSSHRSMVLPRDAPFALAAQPSTPDFSEAASPSAGRQEVLTPVAQQCLTPPQGASAVAAAAAECEAPVCVQLGICSSTVTCPVTDKSFRFAVDRLPLCLLIFTFLLLSISAQSLSTFSSTCAVAREALVEKPRLDATTSVLVALSSYLEYQTSAVKNALIVLSFNDTDQQLHLLAPSLVGKSIDERKHLIRVQIERAKAIEATLVRATEIFVRESLGCTTSCREKEFALLKDVRAVGLTRYSNGELLTNNDRNLSMAHDSFRTTSSQRQRPLKTEDTSQPEGTLFPQYSQPVQTSLSFRGVETSPAQFAAQRVHRVVSHIPLLSAVPWSVQRAISGICMISLIAYVLRKGS